MASDISRLSIRMFTTAMMLTGYALGITRLARELGFGITEQGILVSIQSLGFTFAVLIGGALSDRFGHVRILRIVTLALAIAAALIGVSWAYWIAAIAMLMNGAAGSIMENSITALAMADEKSKDKNNMVVQIAFSIGAITLPVIILAARAANLSWRLAFIIIAVLSGVLFLLPQRIFEHRQTDTIPFRLILSQYLGIIKRPALLIAPVTMFFYVGAEVGLWAFAPVFFEKIGMGTSSGIIASISIWVCMLLGRLLIVRLSERLGIIITMIIFAFFAMTAILMMILSNGLWAVAATAAAGFACAPFFPLILSWMTDMTGERSGTLFAFTLASGTLGSMTLGYLMGLLGDNYGMRTAMTLPLASFVIVLGLLLIFGLKKRVIL